ncbi:T9SS type A sorting domain-containing protein [Flavobacterium sp.]|uniref:T9SS type A sorting domain-containing protein n=1 Tax=Flavobacterium sp. TaxID=239 RepID=UPI00260A8BFD|nr:T9SS type A sorting domain-containing protein [Flavobacterium sp.]
MKKLLLIFILSVLNSEIIAAQYTFDWMHDASEYNKTAIMMATDNSNNVIVTGHWMHSDIYTRKYASNGTFLWEVSNSSGIASNYQKPIWSNCDSSGNIYVVGKRYTISSSSEYADAIVALKYSPSGTLLWKRNLPVTPSTVGTSPSFTLRSEVDTDGNLYIGTSQLTPSGLTLIKLSPTGSTLFQTSNNSNSGYGFGTMRLKNGKIYMTGSSDTVHGTPLVVWDTLGNLIFSAGFVHVNNINPSFLTGFGEDLEVDDTGNIYILGRTNHSTSVATNNIDILVQKVSPTGTLLWQQNYDFDGNDYPRRFALGGNRLSIISYSYGFEPNWRTQQIDTDGVQLWNTVYNAVSSVDEIPFYVTTNSLGEPIVIGKGGPTASATMATVQMVILKYNNSGVQQWISTPNIYGGSGVYCKIANDDSLFAISEHNMSVYHYNLTTLSNQEEVSQKTQIVPNPFLDKITFQIDENEANTKASIYDISGKLLLEKNISSSNNELDLSNLSSGIYFCKLNSNGNQKTIKLIKK